MIITAIVSSITIRIAYKQMQILLFALLYDIYNQVRTTTLLDRDIWQVRNNNGLVTRRTCHKLIVLSDPNRKYSIPGNY